MATQRLPYRWPGLRSSAPGAPVLCRSCRLLTIVGYHDGWAISLDVPALDARGEAEAWILALPTYHAVPPYLYRRTVASIEELWNPTFGAIYRTHKCGMPQPTYVRPPVVRSDEPGF